MTSRNSVFTRSGPGPQYWSPYSWNYANNATLTESVWQQNITWVADNLAPYGYTMCCTDGWVDYTQTTNSNGYITSYSDSWTNGWAYYVTTSGLGMKLGVYYNPLWVAASAVKNTSITVVGTSIPVADIVTSGDVLNSDNEIYWVNVSANGAKEYIQGYVNYFKNMASPSCARTSGPGTRPATTRTSAPSASTTAAPTTPQRSHGSTRRRATASRSAS